MNGRENDARKTILKQAFSDIGRVLDHLPNLAEEAKLGDSHSLVYIHLLAAKATEVLWELSSSNTEAVRQLASEFDTWPMPYSNESWYQELLEAVAESIHIATNVPGVPILKSFNKDTPAMNAIRSAMVSIRKLRDGVTGQQLHPKLRKIMHKNYPVEAWIEHLKFALNESLLAVPEDERAKRFSEERVTRYCRNVLKLGRLNADNWKEWNEVIWFTILLNTNGHPERDSSFKGVATKRAGHNGELPDSKTAESNIRDGIAQLVKSSIKSMVFGKRAISQKNSSDS